MTDTPVGAVAADIVLTVTGPFNDPAVQAAAAAAAAALRAGGVLYAETNESTIRHHVPDLLRAAVLQVLDNATEGHASQVSTQAPPRELSPYQVAAELNVSRNYVRKLIDEETLPHRRVGNRFRIPRAAVMAYKAQQDLASQHALNEPVDLTGDIYIPGRQQ